MTEPGPLELAAMRLLARTEPTAPSGVRAALDGCDPDALARALSDQRLLALLGSRAIAQWGADHAPSRFVEAVDRDIAANRARGLALEALSEQVVARLEEAGIPVLVLKGPLQARRLHGDIGFRHSNDVDLLVSRGDLGTAARLLEGFGYAVEPTTPLRGHGLPDIHLILRSASAGLPRIDLHWRIHWYEDRFSDQMLAKGRKRDVFLEPEPSDDLAALMLFYARDGFFGLRAAVDIAAWYELHRSDPGPLLERHWREYPRLRRAWDASATASERTVGVRAAELLPPRSGLRTTLASNLANWNQLGDSDQQRANLAVVDALLSPVGELPRFLRREVFVTRAEIQSIYGRVVHAGKITVRLMAGLWLAITGSRRR